MNESKNRLFDVLQELYQLEEKLGFSSKSQLTIAIDNIQEYLAITK